MTEAQNNENYYDEDIDYEKEAKKIGWRPEDQYKGPKRWVDAQTYVERGQSFKATNNLKRQNDYLSRQLDEMKSSQSDVDVRMANLQEYYEADYDRKLKDLKGKAKVAASEGDEEKAGDVFDEIAALHKNKTKSTPAAAKKQVATSDPVFDEFCNDNQFMNDNQDPKTVRLIEVAKKNPGKSSLYIVRQMYKELDKIEREATSSQRNDDYEEDDQVNNQQRDNRRKTSSSDDSKDDDLAAFRGNRSRPVSKNRRSTGPSITMSDLTEAELGFWDSYAQPKIDNKKSTEEEQLQTIADARRTDARREERFR